MTLRNNGLFGFIGCAASAGAYATTESFFALLKKKVLNRKHWATREELRLAIVT